MYAHMDGDNIHGYKTAQDRILYRPVWINSEAGKYLRFPLSRMRTIQHKTLAAPASSPYLDQSAASEWRSDKNPE